MPFISDRDLLMFEPTLCRDAGWVATELARAEATLISGELSLSGIDPGVRGIVAGQLVTIAAETCEITAVSGSGTVGGGISVALPRASETGPAIAPANATGPAHVLTFARHIQAAHEIILQQLGITGLAPSDLLHESRITTAPGMKFVEACTALELIFAAAAGASGPASAARQRSEFYSRRASALAALATLEYSGRPVGTRIRLTTASRRLIRG